LGYVRRLPLLAVTIRCITLILVFAAAEESGGKQAALVIMFNLFGGLAFAAALVAGMWWLGHVWLAAVKILVPVLAVLVAYKSLFPLPPLDSARVGAE
jgi:hypothetical protein